MDDDDSAEPTPVAEPTPASGLQPTWTDLHPLLRFRCACHRTNEGGDGGLIGMEDPDLAYDALVGTPSEDVPSLSRIEPGDSESSYLVLKLEDRHRAEGGRGDRMPPTGPALPAAQIDVLRTWIGEGALRN